MAYETPKAIHFDAYVRDSGGKLPWNDHSGLQNRWSIATAVGREVTCNMIGIGEATREAIQEVCQRANAGQRIVVVLAGKPMEWGIAQ